MAVGTAILAAAARPRSARGGLADVLWRNLAVAAVLGPLGVAIGALIRNQVVTVVGLLALVASSSRAVRGGPRTSVASARWPACRAASWRPRRGRLLAPGLALAVLIAWAGAVFAAARGGCGAATWSEPEPSGAPSRRLPS